MIAKSIAAAVLMLGLAATASADQLYRWVDEQGQVHYTQQPPPPTAAKKLEERKFGDKPPSGRQLPYATQVAVKNFPVTLFVAPDCEPCKQGRALLKKRGVPYTETAVQSEESMKQLRELAGKLEVPVLKVGATVILKGFEEVAWNNALDAAGYPTSGPPITEQAAKAPAPAAPPPAQPAGEVYPELSSPPLAPPPPSAPEEQRAVLPAPATRY